MARTTAILAGIALLSPGPVAGQSNWSQYKPGSLAALIREEWAAVLPEIRAGRIPFTRISASGLPTIAMVQYQDSMRPTTAARQHVLNAWARSLQKPLDMAALFPSEVLFREGTLSVWLPTQAVLIPAMREELRRGDRVALYVGYVGAQAEDSTTITWVFIVNEFEKQ